MIISNLEKPLTTLIPRDRLRVRRSVAHGHSGIFTHRNTVMSFSCVGVTEESFELFCRGEIPAVLPRVSTRSYTEVWNSMLYDPPGRYHLFKNNCDNWSNRCLGLENVSEQVQTGTFIAATAAIVTALARA